MVITIKEGWLCFCLFEGLLLNVYQHTTAYKDKLTFIWGRFLKCGVHPRPTEHLGGGNRGSELVDNFSWELSVASDEGTSVMIREGRG